MQWFTDFLAWFSSTDGRAILTTAIIPSVAILVAGLVAALIARTAVRRLIAQQNGELKSSAVMALIGAGRRATVWSSLGGDEKQHVDALISEADIRIRLLPVNGASAAADWAAHELAAMKRNSASFSFQAEQTYIDFRDRLLEWQNKPKRARKLFAFDLEQWKFEDAPTDQQLEEKQRAWQKEQDHNAREAARAAEQEARTPDQGARETLAPTAVIIPPLATAAPSTAPVTLADAPPPSAAPSTFVAPPTLVSPPTASDDSPGELPRTDPADDLVADDEQDAEQDADTPSPITASTVRRRIAPETTIDGTPAP